MGKAKIVYRDVAPGSQAAATASATAAYPLSKVTNLVYGITPPALMTGELNYIILNGESDVFQLSPSTPEIGYWSNAVSSSTGVLSSSPSRPAVTLTFNKLISSMGIVIDFDTSTGEYCNQIYVRWYRDSTSLASSYYYPNSASYFIERTVENFNKVQITFYKTVVPYRRARINRVVMGVVREFGMDELRNVKITTEIDPVGAELPISTLNWTLESKSAVDYMFQLKQPVEAWNSDSLLGVFYVERAKRQTSAMYEIACHDAFGILDDTPFEGMIVNNVSAQSLINTIIGGAFGVTYEKATQSLTGAIMPGTKREAIQQVLFAWGACASTFGGDKIRIFDLDTTLAAIPADRTYTGPTVETDAIVTEVQVTAHKYTESTDGDIEIGGKKYTDTTTVYKVTNQTAQSAEVKANVVQIEGGTLVSPSIGQTVAQRVYNYYLKRNTASGKIVLDGEMMGDLVTIPNPWGAATSGNIVKADVILSNTVAASLEIKGG